MDSCAIPKPAPFAVALAIPVTPLPPSPGTIPIADDAPTSPQLKLSSCLHS